MDAEDVLAGLDPEQRAVAQTVRGPVCVLAGAGTGKTRAITHRIAYAVRTGTIAPRNVLAVTFTTRAAAELVARLRALGAPAVAARTFHAAALRQLTYFWPRVVGGAPPRVIDSKLTLVADAARAGGHTLAGPELRDVAAEIEWAKATQTRPGEYATRAVAAHRTPPLPAAELAQVFEAYEALRRERHLLDFESMIELTAAMLTDHPEVAEQVRDQYRYFVVDEYQDVSPLQKLLLDAWLGGRDDVCVVGDPSQTIYSFAGASAAFLLGFPGEYPDATVIRLVRDYRSTPQVVRLANAVLGPARGMDLVAQRPPGPVPTFTEYDDEPAEAAAVARQVRKLIAAGTPPGRIAVLFRVNAQSERYEQALAEEGIPYLVRGGERFFDRPEVRQAVILLRGAARSSGDDPLGAAVRHVLVSAGLTPQPPRGGVARARWESLAALAQLADDLQAAHPQAGLADFVAELAERAAAQHPPDAAGVTLASLHAAKGLEWDAVFLVGLVDGVLPISYAETGEQLDEERRLLYVGVTRARQRLALSWALARSPGGRPRRPSRFLAGLRAPSRLCRSCDAALPVTGATSRADRCERCAPRPDQTLLARLRSWRTQTAHDQRVPAFVVFSDATLEAIAARRPTDLRELAAISGVGAVKLDRYGDAVLALCAGEERK